MSGSIEQLSEKVKNAQADLERVTQALYKNVHSDLLNARYNAAILALDKAEAELEDALTKFKFKRY